MATKALALLGVQGVATVNADTNATPNTVPLRGAAGDLTNSQVIATSVLQTQGNLQGQPSSQTASFTAAAATDYFCNASGGAITVTLPAASSAAGFWYTFTKTDSSANMVSISGALGISTSTTTQYGTLRVRSDGANWYVG